MGNRKKITVPIATENDREREEFIEAANNRSAGELTKIDEFVRQGVRALISRHLCEIKPDENNEQILQTNIALDTRDIFGMSTNDMPNVKTIIMNATEGWINIVIEGINCRQNLDTFNTDTLLIIARWLEEHPYQKDSVQKRNEPYWDTEKGGIFIPEINKFLDADNLGKEAQDWNTAMKLAQKAGKTLPSILEIHVISYYTDKINTLLEKHGKEKLKGTFWTSTEFQHTMHCS